MPVMDVAHQHMLSARAHGGDELDWTALVGGQRIAAGLQPFAGRVSRSLRSEARRGVRTAADDPQRRTADAFQTKLQRYYD